MTGALNQQAGGTVAVSIDSSQAVHDQHRQCQCLQPDHGRQWNPGLDRGPGEGTCGPVPGVRRLQLGRQRHGRPEFRLQTDRADHLCRRPGVSNRNPDGGQSGPRHGPEGFRFSISGNISAIDVAPTATSASPSRASRPANLGSSRPETKAYDAIYAAFDNPDSGNISASAKASGGIGSITTALLGVTDAAGVQAELYDQFLPDYAGGGFETLAAGQEGLAAAEADAPRKMQANGQRGWVEEIGFDTNEEANSTVNGFQRRGFRLRRRGGAGAWRSRFRRGRGVHIGVRQQQHPDRRRLAVGLDAPGWCLFQQRQVPGPKGQRRRQRRPGLVRQPSAAGPGHPDHHQCAGQHQRRHRGDDTGVHGHHRHRVAVAPRRTRTGSAALSRPSSGSAIRPISAGASIYGRRCRPIT